MVETSGPRVTASVPALTASGTAVREELRRILESPEFAGTERGRTLLTYLVDNALHGGLDRLKERTIGMEIFGRDAAYDTGQDAIVRVSVNSVRKRLAAYYVRTGSTGQSSAVRIHLAPGSYTPEFLAPTADAPEPQALPVETAPPSRKWFYPGMVAALAIACVALGVQNWHLRSRPDGPLPLLVLPWSLFGHPTEARIALTDGNFTIHKIYTRREMTLSEYTSEQWLWELKDQVPQAIHVTGTRFTSVVSAVTAARIGSLLERAGCSPLVGSARSLQLRDFKQDRPIVLLGSAPSNPWVELFDERLNFVIDYDIQKRAQRCRNRAPKAGEEPFYAPLPASGAPGVAYAILSALPNLAGKAPVLIIAGTNAEATEAAGELATDIPRLTRELQKRGIDPASKVNQFELLIRVQHLNQAPSRSEVIAHRLTP